MFPRRCEWQQDACTSSRPRISQVRHESEQRVNNPNHETTSNKKGVSGNTYLAASTQPDTGNNSLNNDERQPNGKVCLQYMFFFRYGTDGTKEGRAKD